MRYLVAMIFAIGGAVLFTLYISSPAATWAVDKMAFDSPDQVGDMHSLIFMASNFFGLLLGWGFGWSVASALAKEWDEGDDD